MKSDRLRVLIIAHELSPIKGSECAVGWNIVTRLSKYHDVTVLYASSSQDRHNNGYVNAINKYLLTSTPIIGLTLINIDQPAVTKLIASANKMFTKLGPTGLPVLYYLGYKYWQKSAFSKAKKLHKIENFDVVHQLTQISFREPGYSCKLGIPFFWGPTGGASTLPKGIYKALPWQFKILENVRSFSNIYKFNFVPRFIKANRNASIIYAFSKEDANRLKKRAKGQVKIMLDVGTHSHSKNSISDTGDSSVLRGIWCGRLTDYKAPSILLNALALSQLTREKIKFKIIGSGSLERSLIKMAEDLNLNNIEWIKEVNHREIFELMKHADLFVHTSLREATSSVIPEALSMALPVICHDAYGMSIAVDETCGIKIPFISPEESIKGFHEAIERLILNRSLLEELKKGANKRSLEISWDIMAETMASDYTAIVNKNIEKSVN
jgi:glycosyltransferase involved in cell wall biosynthesis